MMVRADQFVDMAAGGTGVTRQSPAKINWNLKVLRRRPDGFHDLESLVSPITLYDDLTVERREDSGFTLSCTHPAVPLDGRNLILRAAGAVAEQAGLRVGAEFSLVKRIPIGGGLGGGSSNAATTILALKERWGLNWSASVLSDLASRIGSDVPLFLSGGSVIMTGRGERIAPVQIDFSGWIVLLLPALSVSTAAVYAQWRPEEKAGVPVEPVTGLDAGGWMVRAFNSLEEPAMVVCPPLRALREQATHLAGRAVRMSGSGSSLFTAFDERSEAEHFAAKAATHMGLETRVVQVAH